MQPLSFHLVCIFDFWSFYTSYTSLFWFSTELIKSLYSNLKYGTNCLLHSLFLIRLKISPTQMVFLLIPTKTFLQNAIFNFSLSSLLPDLPPFDFVWNLFFCYFPCRSPNKMNCHFIYFNQSRPLTARAPLTALLGCVASLGHTHVQKDVIMEQFKFCCWPQGMEQKWHTVTF